MSTTAFEARRDASRANAQEPTTSWSHPTVKEWRDAAGNRRASLIINELLRPEGDGASDRVKRGMLSQLHWKVMEWEGDHIVTVVPPTVTLRHHTITLDQAGLWTVRMKLPCPGVEMLVVVVDGGHLAHWTWDRWRDAEERSTKRFILATSWWAPPLNRKKVTL
jgi:hypothetical protein